MLDMGSLGLDRRITRSKSRTLIRITTIWLNESRPAFSERGCQEKHLPDGRPPGRNTLRGSQPMLRRDDLLIRHGKISTLHDNWVFSSETEKQTAALIADHSSL